MIEDKAADAGILRSLLDDLNLVAVSLWGNHGCGKTTLLQATVAHLAGELSCMLIDSNSIAIAGTKSDARHSAATAMASPAGDGVVTARKLIHALEGLDLSSTDLLLIENSEIVCHQPGQGLGEHYRVACLSVENAQDLAETQPQLFANSHANLILKTDLVPQTGFNISQARHLLSQVNSHAPVFDVSSLTGEGLDEWCEWLYDAVFAVRGAPDPR